MDGKGKVSKLFEFTKELGAYKYKSVTDIPKQKWHRFLDEIPVDGEWIRLYSRDRVEEEAGEDMVLLEVRKPELTPCPEVPKQVFEWLEPGWERPDQPVVLRRLRPKASQEEKEPVQEAFEDQEKRVSLYQDWSKRREAWATRELNARIARLLFTQLYEAYMDLERESETLEFMVGNGLVQVVGQPHINHPVIVKRLKLAFDATQNRMQIMDTDTET